MRCIFGFIYLSFFKFTTLISSFKSAKTLWPVEIAGEEARSPAEELRLPENLIFDALFEMQ